MKNRRKKCILHFTVIYFLLKYVLMTGKIVKMWTYKWNSSETLISRFTWIHTIRRSQWTFHKQAVSRLSCVSRSLSALYTAKEKHTAQLRVIFHCFRKVSQGAEEKINLGFLCLIFFHEVSDFLMSEFSAILEIFILKKDFKMQTNNSRFGWVFWSN